MVSSEDIAHSNTGSRGWTLIELMIVIVMSSIVMIGTVRLFKTVVNSYRMQSQITEMHQNGQYAMKLLSEAIAEAGSGFSKRDTALFVSSSNSIKIYTSIGGGGHTFNDTTTRLNIAVFNAKYFLGADSLRYVPADTLSPIKLLLINKSTVTGMFKSGVDTANDSISLTVSQAFKSGDYINPYITKNYYLSGTNLCLSGNANILAENIDSLGVTFFDSLGGPVTTWKTMQWARMTVRSRTVKPDPQYKGSADKYRRVSMSMDFRLRNKF